MVVVHVRRRIGAAEQGRHRPGAALLAAIVRFPLKLGKKKLKRPEKRLKRPKNERRGVLAKPGGQPLDINRVLEAKARDKEAYEELNILAGANRLDRENPLESNIQEITDEMRKCITTAKEISNKVRVIELPPRTNHPDMPMAIARLNEAIELVCIENGSEFVHTDGVFYMKNGEPNTALLAEDGVHLTIQGSKYMAEFLNVESTGMSADIVSPKAAYKNRRHNPERKKAPSKQQESPDYHRQSQQNHTGEKPYQQRQQRQPNGFQNRQEHTGEKPFQQRQPNRYKQRQRHTGEKPYPRRQQPNGFQRQGHTGEKPYHQRQPNGFQQRQEHTREKPFQQRQPNRYKQRQRHTGEKPYPQRQQPNGFQRQ